MFINRLFIALFIVALAMPSTLGALDMSETAFIGNGQSAVSEHAQKQRVFDVKGIPEPDFGINEQAPDVPNFDTEVAGFYYIHRQHPQATDRDNVYGTTSKPRLTIPEDLPAGSVVEIEGFYDYSPFGYSRINAHGTEDNPIFIRGDRITRPIQVRGSYIIIEKLEFNDEDGDLTDGQTGKVVVIGPADHIVVRDNEVTGNLDGGGLHVGSFTEEPVEHVVFYDNKVHDNGDIHTTTDQDTHGIHIGKYAHQIWIVENEIYGSSGDGIQVDSGNIEFQGTTHHIYIGKNDVHDNKQTGIWVKRAVDVIVSENNVYDHEPTDSSTGACVGYQYAPERLWLIYNHLHDCTYGVGSGSDSGLGIGTHVYIIGNHIHDIHGDSEGIDPAWTSAAVLIVGGFETEVIGNLIHDVDAGINVPKTGDYYFSSNVFSDVGDGHHIFIEDLTGRTEWIITRSVFDESSTIQIGTRVYDLAGLQQHFTEATFNVVGTVEIDDGEIDLLNPLFDVFIQEDVFAAFEDLYDVELPGLFGQESEGTQPESQPESQNPAQDPGESNEPEKSEPEPAAEQPAQTPQTSQQNTGTQTTALQSLSNRRSSHSVDDDDNDYIVHRESDFELPMDYQPRNIEIVQLQPEIGRA